LRIAATQDNKTNKEHSDEEAHLQIETNFFRPLRLIQASLPYLRAQESGAIVNVSSVAGFDGLPSCGLYAASKFGLEGLSESLSRELVPFNIRILRVQPGGFRTNFLVGATRTKVGLSGAYRGGPVEETLRHFERLNSTQKGDPKKAAARIFEGVTGTGMGEGWGWVWRGS
jgi:NAD(P)-dependent dehydrogenase (short-subunit alcohol dehydrogenase family)